MAAEKQKIFQICPQCQGTKIIPVRPTIPDSNDPEPEVIYNECTQCLGEGHIEWGYLLVPNP